MKALRRYWVIFIPICMFFVLGLTGCDEDIEKKEQMIQSGVKFRGEGSGVMYFWDGEDKCPATYDVTMTTGPDRTATIEAKGPSFTFGGIDGRKCNRDIDVSYFFKGTYEETNLNDNSTGTLQTNFKFTDCNNGAFSAKGWASRSGNDPILGNAKCFADDGEIIFEVGFDLKPTAG